MYDSILEEIKGDAKVHWEDQETGELIPVKALHWAYNKEHGGFACKPNDKLDESQGFEMICALIVPDQSTCSFVEGFFTALQHSWTFEKKPDKAEVAAVMMAMMNEPTMKQIKLVLYP